jgi:hypothetical protein
VIVYRTTREDANRTLDELWKPPRARLGRIPALG